MRQQGSEIYDLFSVFFLALSGFVCIISVMIIGDLVSAGPFEPEVPTETPTLLGLVTLTPSPEVPSATPVPETEIPTASPTWTDFPTQTPSDTPTATFSRTPSLTRTSTPSSTPTNTLTPTITNTPAPTETPEPPTETPVEDTATPTETATATEESFPIVARADTPIYRDAYTHPGCRWQGVAGDLTLLSGEAGLGYIIRVTGANLAGPLSQGTGTNANYGTSGWEIQLAVAPVAGRYQVQVFSADGTQPLSKAVELQFGGNCQQNLAIVNFVQNRPF